MSSRPHVENLLTLIGEQVQDLEKVKDPAARRASRRLFESMTNLYGLALAKITAQLSMTNAGREIYRDIADDEQVRAVLLLHGLHPDSAEDRIRAAIPALEARLGAQLRILSVADGIARMALDCGAGDFDVMCREAGAALLDAAPDLDDIAIDRAAAAVVQDMPRAAAG
jgi:hypothetical protein